MMEETTEERDGTITVLTDDTITVLTVTVCHSPAASLFKMSSEAFSRTLNQLSVFSVLLGTKLRASYLVIL